MCDVSGTWGIGCKDIVSWDVMVWNSLNIYQHFGRTSCLNPEDKGSSVFWNTGKFLPDCTPLHHKRQYSLSRSSFYFSPVLVVSHSMWSSNRWILSSEAVEWNKPVLWCTKCSGIPYCVLQVFALILKFVFCILDLNGESEDAWKVVF